MESRASWKASFIIPSVEPNLKAKTLDEIDISLSSKDVETIQSGADFIYEQQLTDVHIEDVRAYIDLNFLQKAQEELSSVGDNYLSKIEEQLNK